MNSEVSIYYDPLISKLAAWGRTREESIDRLRRALDEYEVGGIKTTLSFFRDIVRDQEFRSGQLDTGFIARFFERRERHKSPNDPGYEQLESDLAMIAAAIHYATLQREASSNGHSQSTTQNRWKMSGRAASRGARQSMNVHGKRTK